ncbi:MAG: hypothetical protein A4E65_01894 [Syntrophorhabdus sp. PtaU1.Bin153]|nr:MAG: hypothetical protein A4E65_01894 [Syntrophorhabdus sp. PtaU1.Bin153]
MLDRAARCGSPAGPSGVCYTAVKGKYCYLMLHNGFVGEDFLESTPIGEDVLYFASLIRRRNS